MIVEVDDPAGTDSAELREFCRSWWLPVYRIVLRSCRSKSEAEELTQEAFARSLAAQEGLPSSGYLIQTARNLAIDRWRAEKRRPSTGFLSEDIASNDPGPESIAEENEQRQAILAALDALSDRYSEVLRLRFQEGLSPQEVGVMLNMAPNAVRQLQLRAVQALRGQLGNLKEES